MYLNILLKRKKEPTHHFSFNGSTTIKTDKEQIHRGFKDHKGLSYAFNGVNYSIDNKQLFQGHTKNYSANAFNYNRNYDREYFNKFNKHPETRPIELYTEYKNRYPNLSPNQYSIEQWQTEKGTPNELNRFMRHEQTGRSLETIEADDNDYAQGLARLEHNIKSKRQGIIEMKESLDYDAEDKEKDLKHLNKSVPIVKRALNKYKNPVLIKPAIKKDEKYIFDDDKVIDEIKDKDTAQNDVSMEYLAKKIRKRYKNIIPEIQKTKAIYKPVLNEIKEMNEKKGKKEEPQKATITLKPTASPEKTPVTVAAMQKRIDELRAKSAPNSPVTTTRKQIEKQPDDDEGYDSDKTDVQGMEPITVADNIKPFYLKAQALLQSNNLVNLENRVNLFTTNVKAYTKLNKYLSDITGKPSDVKKIGTLRKHLLVQFK